MEAPVEPRAPNTAKHRSVPFWRKSKGCSCCRIDEKQSSVGKKKQAAWAKCRELLTKRDQIESERDWTARECFDHYLERDSSSLRPWMS